jgi:hypothetical protein
VENKARERRHLAQANRQIAELEIRIRRQRAVIKRLIAAGRRTELAVSLLEALESSLREFERYRDLILSALKRRQ